MDEYAAFLARKQIRTPAVGLTTIPDLNPALFPFQRLAVETMLRLGRGALFLSTGLGKTLCQLEWARIIHEHTESPILILAPLAVGAQTVREGARFGIPVTHAREAVDLSPGINVTNYERLDRFEPSQFGGVVLDESSILKSLSGATRNALCQAFADTPYRLACTATPAPNDHMELGNHAEFLGIMAMNEMLQRWFINDTSTASQDWRLKGHAVEDFWDWVSSWAICAHLPSDLGDKDDGYILPPLVAEMHTVAIDLTTGREDTLFRMPAMSATDLHQEKRRSVKARAAQVAKLVAEEPAEPWLVWCDTDYEADALMAAIPQAVEVRGSETAERKEDKLIAFTDGRIRVLVSKPRICGHGLNWQQCARIAFVGVSYSFEAYHQAVRRCWRFGQQRPVHVHVIMAPTEAPIWATVQRKAAGYDLMREAMFAATRRARYRHAEVKVSYHANHEGVLPEWLRSAP